VSVYYPVFLDLTQRQCLVVGGGPVAERKVQGLLAAEAHVVLVSPALTEALRKWATNGVLGHIPRAFQDQDVEGCALVIAATNRHDVNAQVVAAARQRGIWVNAVDTPALCDFIAPAMVRRGSLQIAISTGGNSPLLAKRLRASIEALIGPEYGELADILGTLRTAVRSREAPSEARRAMFL
jgi:precorrin-2 dehydrogenase / sirohydrochlorin ferrochelatase